MAPVLYSLIIPHPIIFLLVTLEAVLFKKEFINFTSPKQGRQSENVSFFRCNIANFLLGTLSVLFSEIFFVTDKYQCMLSRRTEVVHFDRTLLFYSSRTYITRSLSRQKLHLDAFKCNIDVLPNRFVFI